jgi:hypothetical protein
MGRRREDSIDLLCKAWGRERRLVFGLDEPQRASQFLGALRSTLGQRRDLHAGARSNKLEQHFPEVYLGEALAVHHAYLRMRIELKVVMDAHYVAKGRADAKAEAIAVSLPQYWILVREAKAFVEGRLSS